MGKIKISAQPKKLKTTVVKVSKNKVKKREKDSGVSKKKAGVLKFACETLDSPIKSKISKSLKSKNVTSSSHKAASSLQKPTKASKKFDHLEASSPSKGQIKKMKKQVQTDSLIDGKAEKKGNKPKAAIKAPLKEGLKVKNGVSKVEGGKQAVKPKVSKILAKKQVDQSSLPESPCTLKKNLLEGVCSTTLKLVHSHQELKEKKDLFGSQPEQIYMHFTVFKVPETPFMRARCCLPNSVFPSQPDICLIVPDLSRGRRTDVRFAELMLRYEEKLQENGAKGITQILPFTQMRCEYSQFEMKRRLAKTFDLFLCDGRIQGHVVHFLGKTFDLTKKTPVPIHAVTLDRKKRIYAFSPKLQEEINNAINKVQVTLHSLGDSYSVPVGHSGLSEKQLAHNVEAVWNFLENKLPGSLANIKSAFLKSARSLSVPLYASFTPLKEVPVVKPRVFGEVVEDELSTMPGRQVTVHPDGTVVVTDKPTKEDVEFFNHMPAVRGMETVKRKVESKKKAASKRSKLEKTLTDKKKPSKSEDSDISDDDQDVDAAEAAYLANWSGGTTVEELKQEEQNQKDQARKKKKGNKNVVKGKGISQKYANSKGVKNVKKSPAKKNKRGKANGKA